MKPCLKHILSLPDEYQERFARLAELSIRAGHDPETANLEASISLEGEILGAFGDLEKLLREQHPDLFAPRATDQTETPEFKRWFGDSKVVDAKGRPLVVYHGTSASFDAFDPAAQPQTYRADVGKQFFTSSADHASGYAESGGRGANVMPVYLRIKNPRIETAERDPSDWWDQNGAVAWKHDVEGRGHDGLIVRGAGSTLYVTSRPEQIKSAIGNRGTFDPANPDIRMSRDNTREILGRFVAKRQMGLKTVNPASVLEADIANAAKAIDYAVSEIEAGRFQQTEIPVGPTPHTLMMLRAPMQMLVVHTSIVKKMLVDKHAAEFAEASSDDFVRALYKPWLVTKARNNDEFELTTGLHTSAGVPITFVVKQNVQMPPGKNGQKLPAVMAVMTAYARPVADGKDSILDRIKAGTALYADEYAAREAIINPLAQSKRSPAAPASGDSVAAPTSQVKAWPKIQALIQDGVRSRKIKSDESLLRFIGDKYKPENSPEGWRDAPSFSRGQHELPKFGTIAQAQEALQDRYNRWKQSIDAVREQGGTISEANDFYSAEERYWGQVSTRNDEFGKEIEKFVEDVKADGLELSDVALYAYAKHAGERNRHIARKREAMPDGGSGMTTEAADAILTEAEQAGLDDALERHAQTLWDWIDGTRDVLEQGGLITPEQRQAWDNSFRYYVPLRGREDLPEKKRIGAGFNLKGKEGFKAMGRKSEAKQIIEQIIQDRTRAYIRAGKNEVLRSFLAFVLDNPSPNLWQINAVESKPKEAVDANGNQIIEEGEKLIADDRTITVKDGGEEIHILIKDDSLREQMQSLHIEQMPAWLGALQWANRKIGALLTSYNPVFVVLNGMRDFQAASMGMLQEAGFKGQGKFLAGYGSALARSTLAEVFDKPSAEYLEYKRAGGTTGYFGLQDLGKTEEDLLRLARNAERGVFNPLRIGNAVVKIVNDMNAAVEQATRFAAYKAAKQSGMSVAKAASVSKNITVNFNRKGTMSSSLGAIILFFNPAVQGTARLAQALKSPKVMATLGSGMTGLFFLALANADFGGDDDDGVAFWDKVPKEVKERNIVIMRRPKRNAHGLLEADYFKIPMAYGYNVFASVANELADQYRHSGDPARGRKPMESAKNVAQAVLGATIPANGVAQSLDTPSSLVLVPFANAVGPLAQGALNVTGLGRQLHPDSPNEKQLPDSTKYSSGQAGTIFQKGAEKLNELTGGSKYEAGLVDISPGALENAMRFWGGGITSFALDLSNAFYARQHIERPEPDLRRLPFVKQLYGRLDDETDRWFGFDRLSHADQATQPMEAAIKAGDPDAIERIEAKYGDLAYAGTQVRNVRQRLSELRKQEREVVTDADLKDSERYVRLVEISAQVRTALQDWNKAFDEALREKAGK